MGSCCPSLTSARFRLDFGSVFGSIRLGRPANNEPKRAKTSQNGPKRAKTSQNGPKRAKRAETETAQNRSNLVAETDQSLQIGVPLTSQNPSNQTPANFRIRKQFVEGGLRRISWATKPSLQNHLSLQYLGVWGCHSLISKDTLGRA